MAEVSITDFVQALNQKIASLETMVNEMGLDVQASRKTRFQVKTQSVSINYMTRALCVDTIDPWKENRVRFFHPILHDPETPVNLLPFAKPVASFGGFDDCGVSWVPPAASTLCLVFENGDRECPYYIGTSWHRDRGPGGSKIGIPVPEWQRVSQGHRKGYLVGPDDESQVFPPWNTETYNGRDISTMKEFVTDTEEQRRITYAHIYGFKTPEKHMLKMVDGNAKCNRRWKRVELMSGCGNWMCFKDDHLHYGGQWAHPNCVGSSPLGACSVHKGDQPYFTDPHGKPIEGKTTFCKNPGGDPDTRCRKSDGQSCDFIIGGHPRTTPETKYAKSQGGANPYFKQKSECRPYVGPGTPQNNRIDLPQTGIQFISISGHTWVMDDSVEEPRGIPIWERSMQPFDFGCNDKYLGRTYWKSATGHKIEMRDTERDSYQRGDQNFIEILSASGNKIQLNDDTIGDTSDKKCVGCPPWMAGPERGIHMMSTSRHEFNMVDHTNPQCAPCRKEGGQPTNEATQAYTNWKSGYGIEMRMSDDHSQRETQSQWMQITHPQCAGQSDAKCNSGGEKTRGPHILRFQGRPKGEPGVVYLRAGGHAIRQTYDMDIVLVGDKEKNPSDKYTYVSKMRISAAEDVDYRYSGKQHIFFAEDKILLMAGRDCPPASGKKCCGPCLYPVIVGRCPIICPLTGITHWTEKAMSERVFASAYNPTICEGGSGKCPPGGQPQPCKEEDEQGQDIDTGTGIITIGGSSPQQGTDPGSGKSQVAPVNPPAP